MLLFESGGRVKPEGSSGWWYDVQTLSSGILFYFQSPNNCVKRLSCPAAGTPGASIETIKARCEGPAKIIVLCYIYHVDDINVMTIHSVQWRYRSTKDVPNRQHPQCFFNSLFWLTKTKYQSSTLMAVCVGNPPVTGEFTAQRASNHAVLIISHVVVLSLQWRA